MPTKESTETEKTDKKKMTHKESVQATVVATSPVSTNGQSLSTAGFAIAIASIFTNFFTLGIMAIVGLTLSIMGRVQTGRIGHPSGLALAGIIISSVVALMTLVTFVFFVTLAVLSAGAQCQQVSHPYWCDDMQNSQSEQNAPNNSSNSRDLFRQLQAG